MFTQVREHLGITQAPDAIVSGLQADCIPQYVVGHQAMLERVKRHLEAAHPGYTHSLTLLGVGFNGVGVSDCIAYAKDAAQQAVSPERFEGRFSALLRRNNAT